MPEPPPKKRFFGLLRDVRTPPEPVPGGAVDEPARVTEDHVAAAQRLLTQGNELFKSANPEQALAVFDDVEARFGGNEEPSRVKTIVAKALVNRGIVLGTLGRNHERLAIYDPLVARFGDSDVPEIREQVARALLGKGLTLRDLERDEEAIATYAALDGRFAASADTPKLAELVSTGLMNRGLALDRLGRHEEELKVYDTLLARFGNVREVRGNVAHALFNKALTLSDLERDVEAVTTYAELDDRFADSADTPKIADLVRSGLKNRAVALDRLGRHEEEIESYRLVVARYGGSEDPTTREWVATALLRSAITLRRLDRHAQAMAACDELDARFGGTDESPAIASLSAGGLLQKAFTFENRGLSEEEMGVYDALVARYGESTDAETRGRVAAAMYFKTRTLSELGRDEQSIRLSEELDAYFGGTDEPAQVARYAAKALLSRVVVLDRLGRFDELLALCDAAVARYGDAQDTGVRSDATRALEAKVIALENLQRNEDVVITCDQILSGVGVSDDPGPAWTLANALDRKGRAFSELDRSDEAVALFDEAIETLGRVDPEDRPRLLVRFLVDKGNALRRSDRHVEAVVVYDSAAAAYTQARECVVVTPEMTVGAVGAVLNKAGALAAVGRQSENALLPQQLAEALGDVAGTEQASSSAPERRPDAELAEMLAEMLVGDCWFTFATAADDATTRASMVDRALDLYRRTEPWLRQARDEGNERMLPAVLALRSIADGYALLSRVWSESERASLALPTRPFIEWALREGGIDEWAAELDRPLELEDSVEPVEAMLEEQRGKVLDRIETDGGAPEQRLVSAFLEHACNYRLFSTLAASELGRQAAGDRFIQAFATWHLGNARDWATWTSHCLEDAGFVAVAMVLMAQRSFVITHRRADATAESFPDARALRAFLEDTGALEWLEGQEVEIPDWLGPDEG